MNPDFTALRAIGWPWPGWPPAGPWAEAVEAHPHARPARVIEQHRSGYVVAEHADSGFTVESLPEWQRPRLDPAARPAVGDWLLIDGEAGYNARALTLLPRRTVIKRSAPGKHYGQQVIAANIDVVFIVCGLDADFNLRRIERYLLLVRGGARPVIVLTKTDIAEASSALGSTVQTITAELAALAVDVCAVNATDRDSASALHRWLGPGTTAVLVGSSGVGKSTLTNTLIGADRMKTGAVRESDARGRHTTTHRALLGLPTGACLIDTPGMRELKPTGEEDLAEDGFADVEALAACCKFRDCRHAGEPGCAVQAAIAAGTLDAGRFENYQKLSGEIAGAQRSARGIAGTPKPGATGHASNKRSRGRDRG